MKKTCSWKNLIFVILAATLASEAWAAARLPEDIIDGRKNLPATNGQVTSDCEEYVNQYIYERASLSGLYWSDPDIPWYFSSIRAFLKKYDLAYFETDQSSFSVSVGSPGETFKYWANKRYVKIYVAPDTSPYCKVTEAAVKRSPHLKLELISDGLRPDMCIAAEPIETPSASHGIHIEHAIRGPKYSRMQLKARDNQKVLAEALWIATASPSDKFGGYSCKNNSRALSDGFPWNAIDVIKVKREITRLDVEVSKAPLIFPKEKISENIQLKRLDSTPEETQTKRSFRHEYMNDDASIGILWHSTLQIVLADKILQVPLKSPQSNNNFFSLQVSKNEIYVLGWNGDFSVLKFDRSGNPLEAHYIKVPERWDRADHETNGYQLLLGPDGYRIRVHVGNKGEQSMSVRRTYELIL